MLEPAILMEYEDRDEAYFAYWEDSVANRERAMSLGRFDEFWRGLKGLPRPTPAETEAHLIAEGIVPPDFFKPTRKGTGDIAMPATKTPNKLRSPWLIKDADKAYAAYLQMPGLQREGIKKLTKSQFKKAHPTKHAEALKKQRAAKRTATTTAPTTTPATVDFSQFDDDVLNALRAAGIDVPEPEVEEEEVEEEDDTAKIVAAVLAVLGKTTPAATSGVQTTQYRARMAKRDIPEDAARNQLLWALNTEGFLQLVPEGGCDPITQDDGTELMAEEFGPLPERNNA